MPLDSSLDSSEALSFDHGVDSIARYVPCFCSNSTAEVRLPPFWNLSKQSRRTWRWYYATTWGQTHRLQAAQHDNNDLLLLRKGHPHLQRPINRADDVGLGLWRDTGSCVGISRPFYQISLLIWRLKSVLGWLVRRRTTLEEMGMVLPRWSGASDRLLREVCCWRV